MGDAASLPTLNDVYAARERIAADIVRTPLLHSDALDELVDGHVFIKAECLQTTGAFKARGAYNRLRQLTAAEKGAGVVTFSSGNHGQAIAAAARRLGVEATVLMPSNSVAAKVNLTRAQGANVVFFDREREEALAKAQQLKPHATLVPPANDFAIISGQGTMALEILAQLREAGARTPDMLLVPCGSGGLTAGCAVVFSSLSPSTALLAIEPAAYNDTARSLAIGERVTNGPGATSICDALTARTPAPMTFAINLACGVRASSVTDTQVLSAIAFAFRSLKIVIEPGGAVGLAALFQQAPLGGKTAVVICSGGNIDPSLFARAIETAP
jgi:threonine dehydratase